LNTPSTELAATGMKRNPLEPGMLSLIRTLSNAHVARLADEYAWKLYPEPQQLRRRLRFYLRTLLSLRATTTWFELIDRQADLRACLEHEPEMAEKIHRPYRRAGLPLKTRLSLLQDHVRIAERLGWTKLMARAYGAPETIASFADRTGQMLHLVLGRPAQFGKEGELALHITDADTRLYSTCFSFRETEGRRELDIGCIQGPAAEDGRQKIRDLTRNLHGLRPRSLMLEALRHVAAAAGCDRLRMVGNSDHIYRSIRKRRKIAFDYDAFCAEVEGTVADGPDWLLPVEAEVRPLSEVPSKKRAETARRRALLADIRSQIQAATPASATSGQT
jgi:uncharacterized protein VirK/YbjX